MTQGNIVNSNRIEKASWLVYINGIEVPALSIDTTFTVWEVPTLSVSLASHPSIYDLGKGDRVPVVVFWLDTFVEAGKPVYRLLGEYEITGSSYSSSSTSRQYVLQCEGYANIFRHMKVNLMSTLGDIVGNSLETTGEKISSASVAPPATLFREGLTGITNILSAGSSRPTGISEEAWKQDKAEGEYIRRPVEFVLNIIRLFTWPISKNKEVKPGEKILPAGSVSVAGINFFRRWMQKTHFSERWVSFPVLEDSRDAACFPLLTATQNTQVMDTLQKRIGNTSGGSGDMWGMLQNIYGYMYMELGTTPAPPLVTVDKESTVIEPEDKKNASKQEKHIATHYIKPQNTFSIPPTCNVIFPSMLSSGISMNEDYSRQPTRVTLGEQFINNTVNKAGSSSSMGAVAAAALTTGYPEPVAARMRYSTRTDLEGDKSNNRDFLLYPEEFFRGPNTSHLNAPQWLYMLAQELNKTDTSATDNSTGQRVAVDKLMDKYAEYEYNRQRYASSSATVSMVWNPFIVPGFPAVVFDDRSSARDIVGYVTSVSHNMNARGNMSTTVQLQFARPFTEAVGVLPISEVAGQKYSPGIIMYPEEPLPTVKEALQTIKKAENVYGRLFDKSKTKRRKHAFDWRELVELQTPTGTPLFINKSNEDAQNINDQRNTTQRVKDARYAYTKVVPKNKAQHLFGSYTAAMQYVARSSCSIQEYIEQYYKMPLHKAETEGRKITNVKSYKHAEQAYNTAQNNYNTAVSDLNSYKENVVKGNDYLPPDVQKQLDVLVARVTEEQTILQEKQQHKEDLTNAYNHERGAKLEGKRVGPLQYTRIYRRENGPPSQNPGVQFTNIATRQEGYTPVAPEDILPLYKSKIPFPWTILDWDAKLTTYRNFVVGSRMKT